jgi:hypothetical protein
MSAIASTTGRDPRAEQQGLTQLSFLAKRLRFQNIEPAPVYDYTPAARVAAAAALRELECHERELRAAFTRR